MRPAAVVVAVSIGAAAGAGLGAYVGANYLVDIVLSVLGSAGTLLIARWLPKATWSDLVGGSDEPLETAAQWRANIIGLLGFALVIGGLLWLSFR
jgi:hypothetical protein